jgi:hypothetical protein
MTKLALLRAGADTLEGSAGLVPFDVMPGRNKARDFLAVTGNRHFFAVLDQVEQVTEFVLRLESTEFMHAISLQSSLI